MAFLSFPAAAATRPEPCAGGRFLVDGAPLVASDPELVRDAVSLAGETLALDGGCTATGVRTKATRRATVVRARLRSCGEKRRTFRLELRIAAPGCSEVRGVLRRRGRGKARRFTAHRSACGDGVLDPRAAERCDDANTTGCDGCAADCSHADRCLEGVDCAPYVRPVLDHADTCTIVDASAPEVLSACAAGSGNVGTWTVDADGLPAYDLAIDERCDEAARPYTPRARPVRDPLHVVGNGRGLIAMARASGGIELYTQDRGHKWVNRVDDWRDPDDPAFPPQLGGGFSYLVRDGAVWSTRFEDLPVEDALATQARRFGVGYVETVTRHDGVLVRRRTFAPDAAARALVSDVTVENTTPSALDLGLVELWDPNLHQLSVELVTSDIAGAGTTDRLERRRRALGAQFTQQARWDPTARTATLTTTAKALPAGVSDRLDPAPVDWFPEPVWLALLDDGTPPDRVWLSDAELWPGSTDRPPPEAAADPGDAAPARALDLDGARQPAVLAMRVPLHLGPGERITRRFAFGMVPGGGTPDAAVAELRGRGATLAADTAAAWRERLVWAAFPGLDDAAVLQRELAWSAYAALANTSFDEYRGVRVLGQGGSYRFIHGLDGAMGDLALFAEAVLLVDPAVARETLDYVFATQQARGTLASGRFPYATTGNGQWSDVVIYTRRSDAYWFLPAIAGKYLGLTRDAGWLDAAIPYWPRSANQAGTVTDHVTLGLDFAENPAQLGYAARGIVAMGTNDYADGVLNLSGGATVTPTGTSSTYNAGMIVHGFPLAADLLEPHDPALAARMRTIRDGQATALLDQAWEGHYFWRGFVDDGSPLAPHLFFLEPQVFPVLSGIADDARRDLALDTAATLLDRGAYGAISNVPIGTGGPVGGVDQPLVGGVWPVANAWLTAAYARRDPAEAWSSFRRNTLAAHAEAFPDLWYGIWTGPDSFNGADRPRPGEADAHLVTALTDYPALNAHVHTGPLRALMELVGVEGTRDGIRIVPRLPTETFHVRWPRLRVQSTPATIEGEVTTEAPAPFVLEVRLPSGLIGQTVAATVDGASVPVTVAAGLARFAVPGGHVVWRVTAG